MGRRLFGLCRNSKISPLHGDHGLAAIWQDQDKIHPIFAADRLPNGKGLALKRMTSTGYGDSFGKVLMMGSVSWFPSIRSATRGSWPMFLWTRPSCESGWQRDTWK